MKNGGNDAAGPLSEPIPKPSLKLWERVDEKTIRVFLNVPGKIPFKGAVPEKWTKCEFPDSVLVQKHDDGELYIDDRKVELYLAEGQKTGRVNGNDLPRQIDMSRVLHPNILDALFENLHLIPDSWKVDSQGRILYIFFWAVGYRDSAGLLCVVRYLCWFDGQWGCDCLWLGFDFDVGHPAALSAR